MNRKQLVLLLVVGLVLGVAGWIIHQQRQSAFKSSTQKLGEKVFVDFPLNNIAHVTIRASTNELNLVKKDDVWTVKERDYYQANFSTLSDFLRKVWELKVTKPVNIGPSRLPQLELVAPPDGAATLVEFKDANGKALHTLLLGAKHMRESGASSQFGGGAWPDGRYVMPNGEISRVALVSDPFTSIEPNAEPWLDKEFFKVEKAKSLAVEFPEATNSWKLTRESASADWTLADAKDGEELDKNKVAALANPLAYPSFMDVAAGDVSKEEIGLAKRTVVTIETFDGFKYIVGVGDKSEDGDVYLTVDLSAKLAKERTAAEDEKAEDKERLDKEFKEARAKLEEKLKREEKYEGRIYKVSSWTVDPILKKRSELLAEKKEEAQPGADAPEEKAESGAD